jgi:putative endonuclease
VEFRITLISSGRTLRSKTEGRVMFGRVTHGTLRMLDWLAEFTLPPDPRPQHQRVGRRGEEDAYFYLRKRGYVMVARNFRSPRRRGEIDLIGWDADVLCFIEVKTRTSRDVKPAEAAVDREKLRELAGVAGEYLRLLPVAPQWRFDVISVYYVDQPTQPRFELFKNSCPMS